MEKRAHFSRQAPVFNGKQMPEEGYIVGYSAIIKSLKLPVPITGPIAIVSKQNRSDSSKDWILFPNSYLPEDNQSISEIEALYKHLVFALKYEGVNLLVFCFLTQHYKSNELTELVSIEPTGLYSRRIWFLIEWISDRKSTRLNSSH